MGKGRLVETGSFRIDREAALRKPRERRLAEPWDCLLDFIRCAVLSGAKRVEFRSDETAGKTTVRFGGMPLPEADPAALALDAPEPRLRFLGEGLVSARGLGAVSLSAKNAGAIIAISAVFPSGCARRIAERLPSCPIPVFANGFKLNPVVKTALPAVELSFGTARVRLAVPEERLQAQERAHIALADAMGR